MPKPPGPIGISYDLVVNPIQLEHSVVCGLHLFLKQFHMWVFVLLCGILVLSSQDALQFMGVSQTSNHEPNGCVILGIVTWQTITQRIEEGRGQGHRDHYKPWLWIRRKNVSSQGNQVVDSMPGYRRASHFFAVVEWHVALLCLWLGAFDVREQFPMWPHPHLHPLADLPSAPKNCFPQSRGLMRIADEAGIDHGWEVGSDAPYVGTLDLAVTVCKKSVFRLAGISLKPHDMILTSEPTERVIERLELDRRYLKELGAHHVIVDQSSLGLHSGGNLELFSSGAQLPRSINVPSLIEDFCFRLNEAASVKSISAGISGVASVMGLSAAEADLLWRHGVWIRKIVIDITQPIELSLPLPNRNLSIADALSVELFGEVV